MGPHRRAALIAGRPATADARPPGRSGGARRIGGPDWLTRLRREYTRLSELYRQRRALSHLDDRLLDDIAVTRRQADAEAAKPPWKE